MNKKRFFTVHLLLDQPINHSLFFNQRSWAKSLPPFPDLVQARKLPVQLSRGLTTLAEFEPVEV